MIRKILDRFPAYLQEFPFQSIHYLIIPTLLPIPYPMNNQRNQCHTQRRCRPWWSAASVHSVGRCETRQTCHPVFVVVAWMTLEQHSLAIAHHGEVWLVRLTTWPLTVSTEANDARSCIDYHKNGINVIHRGYVLTRVVSCLGVWRWTLWDPSDVSSDFVVVAWLTLEHSTAWQSHITEVWLVRPTTWPLTVSTEANSTRNCVEDVQVRYYWLFVYLTPTV